MNVVELAVRAENLSRDFGAVRAVNRVSLEVPKGTVFGLLGHNGAGKTTIIRLLLGLYEPTGGSAEVLGYDTRECAHEIRRRAGALLEHPGLYDRLSAIDNLEFFARIWRIGLGERTDRIHRALENLGLWERRNDLVGTWSRGMRQRLAIARVLLHRPSLVFLDEPTAGLDPVAAASLRDDIRNLSLSEGVTVFLTTHNLTEAEQLCDNVAVLRKGSMIATGTPDALKGELGSLEESFLALMRRDA